MHRQGIDEGSRQSAAVNVPCPTCGQVNQLFFEPCGTVRSVRPLLPPALTELFLSTSRRIEGILSMGKRTASAETLKPDPRYNSKLASKFVNCLMWQGKKATAMRIFYGALDQIKKRMPDLEPIDVFNQAVEHVKPTVEVRSKRVGGATYQVPMQVNRTRQQSLAIRWIIDAARKQGRPADVPALADEFMAAYRREGEAMTKRENTIKMAESNKAFAHFAW